MINKEKIRKADIYDANGDHVLTTSSITFPKDFFRIKSQELVVIKDNNMPQLDKSQPITVIFEYLNGTRVKYETKIDICTEMQLNFHVDVGEILEDRRSSFKLKTEFEGFSKYFVRNEEPVLFDEPLPIHFANINLGGVLFSADYEFEKDDTVDLVFMDGEMELMAEILRRQETDTGELVGYGCKFLNVTQAQEEMLAKFIFRQQVIEREKMRK